MASPHFFTENMKSNLQNRSIYCRDNIDVLQGINSQCVDLIYLDPPFNKKKVFTAPIGSSAEGAEFSDIFTKDDVKEEWLQKIKEDQEKIHSFLHGIRGIEGQTSYNFCYLAYMAIRIIECHRILKDTGSLYLHCDPTMSHYLKILLDCVFGEKNFRNEIAWNTNSQRRVGPSKFLGQHETILFYCKNNKYWKLTNRDLKVFVKESESAFMQDSDGRFFYTLPRGDYSDISIANFRKENRVHTTKNGIIRIKYFVEKVSGGFLRDKKITDIWNDINTIALEAKSKERTGYPTQKPLALLERIIQASSKKGDLVLDPFCGCATTCIAAEKLGRKWVGIDISIKAYDLVQERLKKEVANPEELFDYKKALNFSTDPPKRTDRRQADREQKYVYVISNKQLFEDEYKVGIAHDIQKRLNSYQTSDPNRGYKLEHKKLTPRYRELERYIHRELQSRHEWVKADLEAIKKTIKDFDKSYLL